MPDPDDGPLDRRTMEALRRLDAAQPGILAELIADFGEDAEGRVNALMEAATSRVAVEVACEAHALRGICGTLGARHLAAIAGRIESAAPSAPDLLPPLLAEMQVEYCRLLVVLSRV